MADRQDQSSGDKNEFDASKADAGNSAAGNDPADAHKGSVPSNLPMIESPSLAGGEDAGRERPKFEAAEAIMIADRPAESMMAGDEASSQPRSFRFALLAATIALTAGVGGLFGSIAASGFGHRAPVMAAIPRTAEARDVLRALKVQGAEIAALKASLESATRNSGGQFARIAQRLDGLERAQVDPAKIAHISETLDRIEKRPGATPDITGSITPRPLAAAAPASAPAPNSPILRSWVIQEVHNGRAMVESRYGGMFLVGAGSVIPGLGRVEAVRHQDGQWVVVTASGTITQGQ